MNAIRTFAEVKDHEIRLKLPKDIKTKKVEVIIIPMEEPIRSETASMDLQRLLLEAPDMTDAEYNLVLEKRKALNQWK